MRSRVCVRGRLSCSRVRASVRACLNVFIRASVHAHMLACVDVFIHVSVRGHVLECVDVSHAYVDVFMRMCHIFFTLALLTFGPVRTATLIKYL